MHDYCTTMYLKYLTAEGRVVERLFGCYQQPAGRNRGGIARGSPAVYIIVAFNFYSGSSATPELLD